MESKACARERTGKDLIVEEVWESKNKEACGMVEWPRGEKEWTSRRDIELEITLTGESMLEFFAGWGGIEKESKTGARLWGRAECSADRTSEEMQEGERKHR